jgi:hypothetical protein
MTITFPKQERRTYMLTFPRSDAPQSFFRASDTFLRRVLFVCDRVRPPFWHNKDSYHLAVKKPFSLYQSLSIPQKPCPISLIP